MSIDQKEFQRQKEDYDRKEAQFQKALEEAIEFYDDEARLLIQEYAKQYGLDKNYSIPVFAIDGVSRFLVSCHQNDAAHRLSKEVRDTVIRMYMGLIDVDRNYLNQVYQFLEQRD